MLSLWGSAQHPRMFSGGFSTDPLPNSNMGPLIVAPVEGEHVNSADWPPTSRASAADK